MNGRSNQILAQLHTFLSEELVVSDVSIDMVHSELFFPLSDESEFRIWPQIFSSRSSPHDEVLTIQIGARFPKIEAVLESVYAFQKRPFSWTLGRDLADFCSTVSEKEWPISNQSILKDLANKATTAIGNEALPALKKLSTVKNLMRHVKEEGAEFIFEKELRIPIVYFLNERKDEAIAFARQHLAYLEGPERARRIQERRRRLQENGPPSMNVMNDTLGLIYRKYVENLILEFDKAS